DRVAKLEVAPSLWRRGLPFCEGVDGKGLLGLLRLPRGSDNRGCARRVGSAELSRYLSHPLAAARILVREVRSTARFPDCSIGGRRAMRNARSLNALSGIWVLVLAAALCAPAKADDQSSAFYKQKCAACHGQDGKGDSVAGKNMKVRSFADPEVV